VKKIISYFSIIIFTLLLSFHVSAQQKIIDRIVATVGNEIILQSDIENMYRQMLGQGMTSQGDMKCEILEDLLASKLMLNQAKIDSIEIGASQVEMELNSRLQKFIDQIGSQEKLEAYYDKSIQQIKADFRDLIKDQMLTQEMQKKIAEDITTTPSEIKSFYRKIPKDSLPVIPSQIEYRQLVRDPPYSEESKLAIRQKLLDLRKRVLNGEDFATLAILYSEDPGSASKGGELGYMGKSELVPEFSEVAFSLKKGAVSPIVKTKFGYHIIQLIDRKDEKVNVRHILLKPKVTLNERKKALEFLDSIVTLIRADSITFIQAVHIYSQDEETVMSGGIAVNPMTGDTRFQLDQLDQATAAAVSKLELKDVSDPFESKDMTGTPVFKVIKITNRIEPHTANLKYDYSVLTQMTKMSKQQQAITDWLQEKQKTTYIRIDDSYKGCRFKSKGWIK
jgi:peptidyl-prolyl cis-trans isomerase SurA